MAKDSRVIHVCSRGQLRFLQPVKAQERTYRLLTDDGLETVEGPTVQGLVNALDLQSDLGNKMVIWLLLRTTLTLQQTVFKLWSLKVLNTSKPQFFFLG